LRTPAGSTERIIKIGFKFGPILAICFSKCGTNSGPPHNQVNRTVESEGEATVALPLLLPQTISVSQI
jgi:hypothetical protein